MFSVQDASGAPFGHDNPRALARLVEAIAAAAKGQSQAMEKRKAPHLGRAAAFSIAPTVTIDNDAASAATVIEASGRDRPTGSWRRWRRVLAEAELSIQSAHIDNYGERAVDAFYVTARQGRLDEPRRAAAVRGRLMEALDDADASASPRLQRARASAAR